MSESSEEDEAPKGNQNQSIDKENPSEDNLELALSWWKQVIFVCGIFMLTPYEIPLKKECREVSITRNKFVYNFWAFTVHAANFLLIYAILRVVKELFARDDTFPIELVAGHFCITIIGISCIACQNLIMWNGEYLVCHMNSFYLMENFIRERLQELSAEKNSPVVQDFNDLKPPITKILGKYLPAGFFVILFLSTLPLLSPGMDPISRFAMDYFPTDISSHVAMRVLECVGLFGVAVYLISAVGMLIGTVWVFLMYNDCWLERFKEHLNDLFELSTKFTKKTITKEANQEILSKTENLLNVYRCMQWYNESFNRLGYYFGTVLVFSGLILNVVINYCTFSLLGVQNLSAYLTWPIINIVLVSLEALGFPLATKLYEQTKHVETLARGCSHPYLKRTLYTCRPLKLRLGPFLYFRRETCLIFLAVAIDLSVEVLLTN